MPRPRHYLPAPVTDRMLACHRLHVEGESRASLARLYGVSVTTIDAWIGRVQDAKNLEAVR